MKYMLLIYTDWDEGPAVGAPEQQAEHEAYLTYTRDLAATGKLLAGDALQGTDVATTVSVRGGTTITTDGPFAETKEVLGGYYVIDADDLDEAIAWAARIPGATWGKIEVRPVMDVAGM